MTEPATPARAPERTVVHLVRHGEVHNPHRVLYGRLAGYRLSGLGQEMAEVVGRHLAGHDVVAVSASPLERAQETAAPIAAAHQLPVGTEERAIEAGSHFEGKQVAGGTGIFRDPSMLRYLTNPLRPSWGEPYAEIAARMRSAVAAMREQARGHEGVIVSHQAPIWVVRCSLEGRRLWHDPRRRQCSLASVTSLRYDGDRLEAIEYAEPAAALLAAAAPGAGA